MFWAAVSYLKHLIKYYRNAQNDRNVNDQSPSKMECFNDCDPWETEASGRVQPLCWDAAHQTQGLPRARPVPYSQPRPQSLGFWDKSYLLPKSWSWTPVLLVSSPECWDDRCVLPCPHVSEYYIKSAKACFEIAKDSRVTKTFQCPGALMPRNLKYQDRHVLQDAFRGSI